MRQDDYRATTLIIMGLAASSLTALVRQAALAHVLGAGRATDVYLVAFALPEFAFVAMPIVLAPAFLPLFAERRMQQGDASAWRFGLCAAGLLFGALLLASALVGLSAPLFLPALAPGLAGPERAQAVQLLRLMLPAVALYGLITLATAVLQVYRRFARPALASAVFNVVFAASLWLLPAPWLARRAAWGVLLGSGAALIFLVSLLSRHLPVPRTARPLVSRGHASLRLDLLRLLRLAGPMVAGYAVHHAILLVDRALATTRGVGRAASLQYAYHLALVVGQVSGLAVSTALFPRLAEHVSGDEHAGIRAALGDALRFVLLLGAPAACALVFFRVPTIQVLLSGGAFDASAADLVTQPLAWYAIAVLADAFCQPLWRLVYAHHRPWVVLAINSLQTGVRLVANLTLLPSQGHVGLAQSALIGLALQACVLSWWASQKIGRYLTRQWWSEAGRIVLAATAATGAAALGLHGLGITRPVIVLVAAGTVGGSLYLITLRVLGLRSPWQTATVSPG